MLPVERRGSGRSWRPSATSSKATSPTGRPIGSGVRPYPRYRSHGYPSTPPRPHHMASSPDCCLPGSAPRPSGIRFEQQRGQRGRFVWLVMGSGSGEAARRDPNCTATRADPTKLQREAPLVEIVSIEQGWNQAGWSARISRSVRRQSHVWLRPPGTWRRAISRFSASACNR